MSTNKFLIEGLDRLGKDTLINGILNKRGYHQVIHYSKPLELDCYIPCPTGMTATEIRSEALREYQVRSFRTMFQLLRDAQYAHLILNRAHLGECVYAPLYRQYSGDYVFDLERQFKMNEVRNARLILLWEDFQIARHFVDDGESLGAVEKRETEQNLFFDAFEESIMPDKRKVCVTDQATGGFRRKEDILAEVLES